MKLKRIILSIMLMLSYTIIPSYAKEAEDYYTGYHHIDFQPDERTQPRARIYSRSQMVFDEKFDPREEGLVSSIRDQKLTETCWAYSTVAMAESNLIKQGLADKDIDLSEHQLAYFVYNTSCDPLGNTEGDNIELHDGNYLSTGGNYIFSFHSLSTFSGLVDEKVVSPMPELSSEAETIDPDYQYQYNSYTLKNAYYAHYDINTIKEFVTNYGSAGICYQFVKDDETMNETHNAIYNPKGTPEMANHSVTIVGWDDHYDKSNFTISPENDGAWLVKNTWGEVGSEKGYFWISYEEPSITDVVGAEFEKTIYDYNYHYDGNASPAYLETDDEMTFANVYQVKGNQNGYDELLKAVNIGVQSADTEYSIEIYKNLKYGEDPRSGILATTSPIVGRTTYTGYYTVELDEPITLAQGDYYSIVVTLKKPSDKIAMMMEMYLENDWVTLHMGAKESQSYCYYDGEWKDLYNEGCTARIKGLTVNTNTKSPLVVEIPKSKTLEIGEQQSLQVHLSPSETTTHLTWKSSNPDIVCVDKNGKIMGVSVGQATIIVTTEYGLEAMCEVTVNERKSPEVVTIETPQNDNNIKDNNIMESSQKSNDVDLYSSIKEDEKKDNEIMSSITDYEKLNENVVQEHMIIKQSVSTSDENQIGIWIGVISIAFIGMIIFIKKK